MGSGNDTESKQQTNYLTSAEKLRTSANYGRRNKLLEIASGLIEACELMADKGEFSFETLKPIDPEVLVLLQEKGYNVIRVPIRNVGLSGGSDDNLDDESVTFTYKNIITWV